MREMTPAEREFKGLCEQSEAVSGQVMTAYQSRIDQEGGDAGWVGFCLAPFIATRCPRCGAEGAYRWHFLGRLQHPECGESWTVSPLEYLGRQLVLSGRSGFNLGGEVFSQGGRGSTIGGYVIMIVGFLVRLVFGLAFLPLQAGLHFYALSRQDRGNENGRTPNVPETGPMLHGRATDGAADGVVECSSCHMTWNRRYLVEAGGKCEACGGQILRPPASSHGRNNTKEE